ncbi:MAG TPA: winged helix-turn-helix transcriptional regulator [Methanocella sp.]|uniref:winged helix-turn-helix transcriptional regulator n=1 Tax=Methanocella sp. TaxID=2052833 RepID=UPI002BF0C611|nr:winged helix-turn-helix transcriptional regulator [Methanocella sp.]HTY90473.1 winged helix-turn-helix transcriptional regulator [Methanocella sp.]
MKKSKAFEAVLVIGLICLAGLLYYMIASSPQSSSGWEKQANGSVDYMFAGGDDTLYTFSGNDISAFSKDGSLKWHMSIPGDWRVLNTWSMPAIAVSGDTGYIGGDFYSYPITGENNGTMYLLEVYAVNESDVALAGKNLTMKSIGTEFYYETPEIAYISKPAKVVEISPAGKVTWEYTFMTNLSTWNMGGLVKPDYYEMMEPIAISVHGDRIYVFHDYMEDILDEKGSLLFSIRNASAPAAVDGSGRIYVVHAVPPSVERFNQSVMGMGGYSNNSTALDRYESSMIYQDATYMLTSGTVEAYSPAGSLLWSRYIGVSAIRPHIDRQIWPSYNTLPLLSNGELYVPVDSGIVALDEDGGIRWTASLNDSGYTLFSSMPLDGRGNVYMAKLNEPPAQSYLTMISADGRASAISWPFYAYGGMTIDHPDLVPVGGKDGIVYAIENMWHSSEDNFNKSLASRRFSEDTIVANDVTSGRELWNFTIPSADVHVITLNRNNAGDAFVETASLYPGSFTSTVPLTPVTQELINVYPGRNVTYVNFYYASYEAPLFPNLSRCIYAKGIYALDNNGKLLWEKDPDGFVRNMAVGNSTIYYSMDNGRIGGTSLNIAAGAILTALTYLFLRFFAAGSVTRARSRIDKNEKRNEVQKFIVDNPGSTLRDIARGTGVNLGTVRYHVLILSLNHRIVSYAADDKHVRYFTNSGAYSKEEQLVISLMRRDSMGRILALLKKTPGLTNIEISLSLGSQESAVSRYMKELSEKGVVTRNGASEGRSAYSINEEYKTAVSTALGLRYSA